MWNCNIISSKPTKYVEEIIDQYQFEFWCSRSAINYTYCIRPIRENKWEYTKEYVSTL